MRNAASRRRERLFDISGITHRSTRLELQLADVYDVQGRHELAEPLFLEAVASLRDQLGNAHPLTQRTVGQVVSHYRARGMSDVADKWEADEPERP